MRARRFAAIFLMALAPATAVGQDKGSEREIAIKLPVPDDRALWRVAKVDPSGLVALKFEGAGDARNWNVAGYALLIPRGHPEAVARVFVSDVEEKAAVAKTSPEAVRLFGEGNAVLLLAPDGAPTALKVVPERVSLAPREPGEDDPLRVANEAANRSRSTNNLKRIGLALHNWHSSKGGLPPAVVRGPDGEPRHSWRVLLLPYLGEKDLFNQYDFSQPWGGEHNRKLLDNMPAVYRDPSEDGERGTFTHYGVLSGAGTPFPPEGAKMKRDGKTWQETENEGIVRFGMILDGLSNTLAVAPMPTARKVPWTKPEDIAFGEDFPALDDPKGIALPYKLKGESIAPVLLMDGAVKTLWSKTNPAVVNGLATKSGGETMPMDVFDRGRDAVEGAGAMTITIRIEGDKATATVR